MTVRKFTALFFLILVTLFTVACGADSGQTIGVLPGGPAPESTPQDDSRQPETTPQVIGTPVAPSTSVPLPTTVPPTATANPTRTPTQAPSPTPGMMLIPSGDVLELLSEIDSIHRMDRAGDSYHDFRYQVVSGSQAGFALVAVEDGQICNTRFAADDVLVKVFHVSPNAETYDEIGDNYTILVPPAANASFYEDRPDNKVMAFSEVTNWDAQQGATRDDILTQWIGSFCITMAEGDYLIFFVQDDENLEVNVGQFTKWTWNPGTVRATPVAK